MPCSARVLLTVVLACVCLAGCADGGGGTGGTGGTGSADCAAVVVYNGHMYLGRGGLRRDPATTGRLVPAVLPSCDDTGGQAAVGPGRRVQVSELADVPLETALLWNGGVYLRRGRDLPVATRTWFRAPRCTSAGEFDLTGDWVGVTSPKEPRFDGDLRPPYRLEVHVTDGPARYVGTTVRVHADAATHPRLGRGDVKATLWTGGAIAGRIGCVDGHFRALSLRSVR